MLRRVGFCAILCLLKFASATPGEDATPASADVQLLKSVGIATDTPSLLQYFRNRATKGGDWNDLQALVQKLNSNKYKEREDAMRELTARGPDAAPISTSGDYEKNIAGVIAALRANHEADRGRRRPGSGGGCGAAFGRTDATGRQPPCCSISFRTSRMSGR